MRVLWEGEGRPLYVEGGGTLWRSVGRTVHRTQDDGLTWQVDLTVPLAGPRALLARGRAAARLLRTGVQSLLVRDDGTRLVAVREGVYRAGPGEGVAERVYAGRGPLVLAEGDGVIAFGDYTGNPRREPVRIHRSIDGGRSFEVALELPAGLVRHVHSLAWDPFDGGWWLFAGDHEDEPGIGRLGPDLREVTWVQKGHQLARAVHAFIEPDALVYGTDTERAPNRLVRLDKSTGALSVLRPTPGACLHIGRCGAHRLLATSVEPSRVNPMDRVALLHSTDGATWREILDARKDDLPFVFGFGSLVLPRGSSDRPVAWVGGQGIEGLDGRMRALDLATLDPAAGAA